MVRTKIACSCSKKKNQTKLGVVGLPLECITDTELKTKSPSQEVIGFPYL